MSNQGIQNAVLVFWAFASRAAGLQMPRHFSETSTQPNIVWVMADDLGYGEVGALSDYPPGRELDTPNLDHFGREGMIFDNAYAGYTVCAPSRMSFFTGRHVGSFAKNGLDGLQLSIHQSEGALARLLKEAGYRTGVFGKASPFMHPLWSGFDEFLGQVDQNLCHNMYPTFIDAGNDQLNYKINGKSPSRDTCLGHPSWFNYSTDVFHQGALRWLESVTGHQPHDEEMSLYAGTTSERLALDHKKPFFLYMSYTIPHAGGWGDYPRADVRGQPVPMLMQYASRDWPDVEKDHAAAISYLDHLFGELMRKIKEVGVHHNTLVFFASDNGAHAEGGHRSKFFQSAGKLRGQKRSLYEGGLRSPTMVRWPGVIKANKKSTYAWAFWDVLPTIADIAGFKAPADIDGVSILPTLLGEKQPEREYLFWSWRTRYMHQDPDDLFMGGDAAVAEAPPRTLAQIVSAAWQLGVRVLFGAADGDGESLTGGDAKPGIVDGKKVNIPAYAVRQGNWKGVVSSCGRFDKTGMPLGKPTLDDKMQLYDLGSDPEERYDVAEANPMAVRMLKELVVSKDLSCDCFQCDWPPP